VTTSHASHATDRTCQRDRDGALLVEQFAENDPRSCGDYEQKEIAMRTASMVALALVACADDPVVPPDDNTIELTMQVAIPPGTEAEYCQFVEIPDAWVTRDTVEFTGGSHHVLVYQTSYTTIPTQNDEGTPVDTSGPFDCSSGPTNGWSVTKLIGGSQNREGDSIMRFPEGVGLQVGGIAMINVHYINGADTTLETDVTVRFDTVPEDEIEVEGDILFLYNPFIAVMPNSTARAHWRCPVYSDITIANAQSHMHARGVGYEARVDAASPFYATTQWEGVPVQSYENFTVRAGQTLDYYCDYRNTGTTPVFQGPRTTDEMCMLIGSYYPADPRTANCTDASGQLPGGDWVGQGTATCAATLGCLQNAGALEAVTSCVLAADAAVSHEVSELVRCFISKADPSTECGAEITACAAK
jgi:hypothetical protein